jgi:alkylation response protein AidB-like acyl-CoA dehydrogenase
MSQTVTVTTVDSLLDIVREIEPVIREHAPEAERERRLSDTVADAMRERGLYRMWRPRALGGLELNPMDAFRVLEELARIDSAAAWNLQMSCAWDTFGAWFPDDGAEEIFGYPDTTLAGAGFPPLHAVRVDGGYRVTGRQPFVSGAHHARWFMGLAHVFDGDTPRLWENGQPVTLVIAWPRKDGVIIDTWHTLGMRGTGSHDVAIRDVFVPDLHAPFLVPWEKPGRAYQGPLYNFTIWAAVVSISLIPLGIARAALDELLALASKKTPSYTTKALRDRPVVQSQLAQAEARLGAARAYVYQTFDQIWHEAVKGQKIDMRQKAYAQLAATHAILASAEVVDLVHAAAGTTGIRNENQLQRHFRDVHTVTQHGFASASRYESAGQVLLGLPHDWPFFGL